MHAGVVSRLYEDAQVDNPATDQIMTVSLPRALPEQVGLTDYHEEVWCDSWNFAVNQNYTMRKEDQLQPEFAAYAQAFTMLMTGVTKRVYMFPNSRSGLLWHIPCEGRNGLGNRWEKDHQDGADLRHPCLAHGIPSRELQLLPKGSLMQIKEETTR